MLEANVAHLFPAKPTLQISLKARQSDRGNDQARTLPVAYARPVASQPGRKSNQSEQQDARSTDRDPRPTLRPRKNARREKNNAQGQPEQSGYGESETNHRSCAVAPKV